MVAQISPDPSSRLSRSDSFTVLFGLAGLFVVIFVPQLLAKIIGLICMCIATGWFVRNSHWTHHWRSLKRYAVTGVIVALMLLVCIPQFVNQWKIEHPGKADASLPTLLDLFKDDFTSPEISCAGYAPNRLTGAEAVQIQAWLCFDFASRSKFLSFYIPHSGITPNVLDYIANNYDKLTALNNYFIEVKKAGEPRLSSKDFTFSGRIYLYHEDELTSGQRAILEKVFGAHGVEPVFRGTDYLQVQILKKRATSK
jgi:hypothetical protein